MREKISEKTSFIKQVKDFAPLIFQAGSIIFLLVNIYFAFKLAPLTQDLRSVVTRVDAIEKRGDINEPLVGRFLIAEQEIKEIKNNIKDIKQSQIRLEEKIDTLIFQGRN